MICSSVPSLHNLNEFSSFVSFQTYLTLGENDKKQEEILSKQTNFNDINDANDINDLYNSSQMYCKNLEKQVICFDLKNYKQLFQRCLIYRMNNEH